MLLDIKTRLLLSVIMTFSSALGIFTKRPGKQVSAELNKGLSLEWEYTITPGNILLILKFEKHSLQSQTYETIGQVTTVTNPPSIYQYVKGIKINLPSTLTILKVQKSDITKYRCVLIFSDRTSENDFVKVIEMGTKESSTPFLQSTSFSASTVTTLIPQSCCSSMQTTTLKRNSKPGSFVVSHSAVSLAQPMIFSKSSYTFSSLQGTNKLILLSFSDVHKTASMTETGSFQETSKPVVLTYPSPFEYLLKTQVTSAHVQITASKRTTSSVLLNTLSHGKLFTFQTMVEERSQIVQHSKGKPLHSIPALSKIPSLTSSPISTKFSVWMNFTFQKTVLLQKSSLFHTGHHSNKTFPMAFSPPFEVISSSQTISKTSNDHIDKHKFRGLFQLLIGIPSACMLLTFLCIIIVYTSKKRRKRKIASSVNSHVEMESKLYI